jgi:NAD(P)-dependent dehydrogenase (short-subunit alcohol dehydrogenase family)
MPDGGRVLALTYAAGSRTGGLQPWVGMGAAKAAMVTLVRYFAVALAARGIAKTETEASQAVFETLKRRDHPDAPPPTVSDGWGGIDDAMLEVYGGCLSTQA